MTITKITTILIASFIIAETSFATDTNTVNASEERTASMEQPASSNQQSQSTSKSCQAENKVSRSQTHKIRDISSRSGRF